MTMEVAMKLKVMPAGEFKAKCLALMDEVLDKRTTVTITKNGKPVAQMVPYVEETDPIFGFYCGKAKIVGDITAPIYTDTENDEFLEQEMAKYVNRPGSGKR
jgi:prevent-host-death family protein